MAKTTTKAHVYEPELVLPPGETLVEVLEERGMTQAELATRTGLSNKHINQIAKGRAPITTETSLLLERVTGVAARVWSNLETAYREHLHRIAEAARLKHDLAWLDGLPTKELIRRGRLKRSESQLDLLENVCSFFGVANRATWEALWHKPTAYRSSKAFTSNPEFVAAWLRIGEIEAASIECARFDKTALKDSIGDLRAFTLRTDPQTWWPELVDTCATFGVAVVAEPEIKGTRMNGATRWLTPHKALVQLSLRHRWSDIFWFTFFHEIGHLLLHSKKDAFINDVGAHSGVEQEADSFASQVLIPREYEADLADLNSIRDVENFAQRLGIAPGIVVGRLQHDKRWTHDRGNGLKQRFVFDT